MAQRGISAKQREWLTSQLDDWRAAEIVAPDQVSRILDLYETPAQLAERGRSLLLSTLMGVAALLVALAVLLLIGYNWQAMPAAVKLSIIFSVLIATHAAGLVLRYRGQSQQLSDIAFFLGCLFFGAAIFLVAQIFHLSGHYPDTVWWWALGVFPFALCLESVLLHALLAALLALWCGMEVLGFADLGGWFWFRWGFIPNGAYSLPLLILPGLLWAYRRSSLATVWLYVLVLTWWAVIQPSAWRLVELSPFFIGAVAGVMLLIADSHPRGSRLAAPYRELGILLMAGTLLVLSFYEASEGIFSHRTYDYLADSRPPPFLGPAGASALLVATAIVALGVWYLASKMQPDESTPQSSTLERMLTTARRQWLALGLIALMLGMIAWWIVDAGALIPTILANVAMIVLGFWLIGTGLREESGRTFAAGVVYLLVWTVMRYIDLFGDFGGMLGAAGMFLVCGLALFAVAWYWRQRKEVHHV